MLRQFIDPIKYGVGVGRVKVLENKLLTRHQIERLVEADTLEETLRVLAESDYGRFLEDVKTFKEVEKSLEDYLREVYSFLAEVLPDEDIIRFFRLKYDFQNLKALLKEKYGGEVGEEFSGLGFFNVEEMKEWIEKELEEELPKPFSSALSQVKKEFERRKDPQIIEIILDKTFFKELYSLASRLKRDYLKELVKMMIDFSNLKTFLRAIDLGEGREFLKKALLEGGNLKKEELLELTHEPLEVFSDWLKSSPYSSLASKILEGEKIKVEVLDKVFDDFLIEFAKRAKFISVGPEPIIGYVLAKENEVKILRLILMGKTENIPKERLREKVRVLYV